MHFWEWLVTPKVFYKALIFSAILTVITVGVVIKKQKPLPVDYVSSIPKSVTVITSKGSFAFDLDGRNQTAAIVFGVLAKGGFYDGVRVHRIVPDFLIEMGNKETRNQTKADWGKANTRVVYPTTRGDERPFEEGTVAMVSDANGNDGTSFFVVTQDVPFFAGDYTIIGKVNKGMETVKAIAGIPVGLTGIPEEDVLINRVEIF